MLRLSQTQPLAAGRFRLVFAHPDDPLLLVKVLRAEIVTARAGRWLKRRSRVRHYGLYLREIQESLALAARFPDASSPIARTLGTVVTDLGLGLVAELVRDAQGAPAPTLETLVRERGFTDELRALLDALLAELMRCDVIVGDMHPRNIVYGSDSGGGPRLVLIDGFGEKNALPLCSMSRAFNRHNTRRRIKVLMRKIARLAK
jgi:hypothetical protein